MRFASRSIRLTARRADLLDDLVRGPGIGALAVEGRADVVDDHPSALRGERQRVGTAEAAALRGKAAVANARLAYQAYEEVIASDRWEALSRAGANPQRPLWASTGVKDPAVLDSTYVVELVAADVVERAVLARQAVELGQAGAQGQRHVVARVAVGDREDVEVVDLLTARLEMREGALDDRAEPDETWVGHSDGRA